MDATTATFPANARRALDDATLQTALEGIKSGWQAGRTRAAANLPEFDALRDQGRDIKDHVLTHLDLYIEAFTKRAEAAGAIVHFARDPAEARAVIDTILKDENARVVTKSKSMVAEEIGLNAHLEANGIDVVETDLGEYIIQLAKEPPSHLIGPAVHKTKDEISDLFQKHHGGARITEAEALVGEARRVLRKRYFEADVGITGANFCVAETGSIITVTNEGNAELTQGLPRVHVCITSIEKMVPTMEDAFTLLRLLARSATGQEFSAYTTVMTGPKRTGDADGPERFHIVLLDNGRTRMIGSQYQEMLRCIRCGACMNHCPVYLSTGGHAYGWVYVGPMGAVLTPQFLGVEEAKHLPNASTFCGRCEEVCPMRIPLPGMMRHLREEQWKQNMPPPAARYGLGLWAFFAKRPSLYRMASAIGAKMLAVMAGRKGKLARLPLGGAWTASRDMPAPEGSTFMAQWARAQGRRA